ncbi:hypothetical protein J122_369 [Marinobacter excellens LAMA 842]|uniref:Uncharacterized protein n=1 Tax=Marinobacter excellens LAMA 842 TaxID=1306954 RepID=A0A137SIQ2_9GAMM|nr:hypothetical protein J122_369 [Marinobacter excellens LAMA 842]
MAIHGQRYSRTALPARLHPAWCQAFQSIESGFGETNALVRLAGVRVGFTGLSFARDGES